MSITFLLVGSVIIQLLAAGYALYLIKLTGFRFSWIFITLSFILMGVRRLFPLFSISVDQNYTLNFFYEIIGLVLSVFLLIGLYGITAVFRERILAEKLVSTKNEALSAALESLQEANAELMEIREAQRVASLYARNLIETSLDPLVTISPEGKITDVNTATEKITGRGRGDLINSDFSDYFTEPEQARRGYQKVFEQGQVTDYPLTVRHSSGRVAEVLYNASVYRNESGSLLGVFAAARDVTIRKAAEDKIRNLLAEKERILKEVHHRIKNNMMVIRSLLSMQAESQGNPETAGILLDAASRVQSMMVLYDKLYRAENTQELPLREYLTALVGEIIHIFPEKKSVKVETHIADIMLGSEVLSPLGIMINELITNSMKYAFAGRAGGLISVSASILGNTVSLEYGDDGIGLPESVTFENSTGFGMQLIKGLVAQIDGSITLVREAGARFIIEFEKQDLNDQKLR